MTDSVCYPFSTLSAAISFYRLKNPARSRESKIYDRESGGYNAEHGDPADLWASVSLGIAKVIRLATREEGACFAYWHIILRDSDKGKDFIAQELRLSQRQVNKNIEKIENEIAKELIRREVLHPDHESIARDSRMRREKAEKDEQNQIDTE